MGPLMINMAFMPLYIWEMWDVTPVTDGQWESRAVFSLSWIRNESNMTDRVWHFTAFAFPFHVFFMFWLMQRVDNLLRLYHIVLMVSVALQDYALAEQYPLTLHLVAQWVWWKWRWWLLLHLSLHIWPCHYLINSFRLDKWALDNMVWCGVVWSGLER